MLCRKAQLLVEIPFSVGEDHQLELMAMTRVIVSNIPLLAAYIIVLWIAQEECLVRSRIPGRASPVTSKALQPY